MMLLSIQVHQTVLWSVVVLPFHPWYQWWKAAEVGWWWWGDLSPNPLCDLSLLPQTLGEFPILWWDSLTSMCDIPTPTSSFQLFSCQHQFRWIEKGWNKVAPPWIEQGQGWWWCWDQGHVLFSLLHSFSQTKGKTDPDGKLCSSIVVQIPRTLQKVSQPPCWKVCSSTRGVCQGICGYLSGKLDSVFVKGSEPSQMGVCGYRFEEISLQPQKNDLLPSPCKVVNLRVVLKDDNFQISP